MKTTTARSLLAAFAAILITPVVFGAVADVTGLVPTIWWDFETKPNAAGLQSANKGSASISFSNKGTAAYGAGVTNGWALNTVGFSPYSASGAYSSNGNAFTVSAIMTLGTTANGITLNVRCETAQKDLIIRRGSTPGSLVIGLGPQKAASTKFLNATVEDGDTTYHLVSVVAEQSGTSLYVDGDLVDATTDFTLWHASGCASRMQFGERLSSNQSGEVAYGGLIDDLRIHDAALTPAQMKAIAIECGVMMGDSIFIKTTGDPEIGKDSFSVPWSLYIGKDFTANAAIVLGADAALSAPTTNALGSALAAGNYTASLSNLASGTTYWWKIVASNGVNWAETPVASFLTLDELNATVFAKRIPITVSGYAGTETLANFPVLVTLAAGAPVGFDYADCAPDGADLRFADATGAVMPHEFESWDPTGTSYIWVKVPFLSGTTTTLSLYYGADPAGLPAVSPSDVWLRYAVVVHGGSGLSDSSPNALAVANGGGVAATATSGLASGGIAKAANKSIGLNVANPSSALSNSGQFSVSAWFKRDGNGGKNNGTHILASSRSGWSSEDGFAILQEQGSHISVSYKGGHNWNSGSGILTNLTWGHIAFAYDKPGAMLTAYFNGGLYQSKSDPTTLVNTSGAYWTFGSLANAASDDSFKGEMDEIRVFNGVASGDWIKAEYDSVAAPSSFVALGAVEPATPSTPCFGLPSTSVFRSDVTFSVAVSNVTAETAVSVFCSLDGSTFTEIPLGTLNADGTLTYTATGMDVGTYTCYARAVSTVGGVAYTSRSRGFAFTVTYAKDPTQSYRHFTATVSYAGTPATDVPVLLKLSESAIDGFRYADVTESGFECVDGDGNLLPWEIDTWNTNGESLVWVKLPSYGDGATITVRYGGTFSNARPAPSAVWGDYVGVWHLDDTNSASAYGSYLNSTATPGIDGEKAEASIADEDGVIGKSVKICDATKQGTGYQLGGVFVPDSGANSPIDLGDTFAISGWFKHKDQDYHYDKFFAKRKKANNQETPNGAFAIEVGNSGGTHNVSALGGGSTSTKVNFNSTLRNTWSYLTFVYDGTSCRIYQNGVLCGTSAISAVTDNNAPLCFGNMTIGYGNGTGDCAWCGWIDEVRLSDGVPTADWIAAEYAAMADTSTISFGTVASVDMGDPRISTPIVERQSDGSFLVTAEISQNEPVAGSVKCVAGQTEFTMTTSDTTLPATYTALLSGLAAGTYTATVQAESAGGNIVSRTGAAVFHVGALTVTGIADADETTLSPGILRISRADTDPTDLPAVTFDVAFSGEGLDAIEPPSVTTLTILSGESSVDVSVTPTYTTAIETDTTLTLTVSGVLIGTPSSGSITITNAIYDPTVRYVATTGNDANHGGTPELPKKTIAAAIASLDYIVQDFPCVVHVAPGLYPISSPINVANAISVIGADPDPSRTFVSNKTDASYYNQDQRIFRLNHAQALVANLTMQKGQDYGDGGDFYIGSNGGTVSNCVVEAGYTRDNGKAGGGWLEAGLVTHTIFRRNSSNSGSVNWQGNRPGVLQLNGQARAENCLFTGNNQYRAVTLINLAGSSVMRNCTIADTSLSVTNEYCTAWSALRIDSGATAQNVVIAGVTNTVDGAACRPTGTVANFRNGAFDGDVTNLPAGTITGTKTSFFRNCAAGDYRPVSGGPLVGKGANYEGMAAVDLSGRQKRLIGRTIDIGCFEANAANTVFFVK